MTPTYPQLTDSSAECRRLYRAFEDAEQAFIAAYTADPNRRGMRPGDFRYRRDLHSPATRLAAEEFSRAGDAWRAAYRKATAHA